MNRPINKAVLLAAGRGTRMRDLTNELPKPMIVVRGKPILQHIIEGLRAAGVTQFLIIVSYRAEVVRQTFRDGALFGLSINYATQVVQDGTGRVVELARDFAGVDPFVLSYGDIIVDPINYPRLTTLEEDTAAIICVKRHEDVSKGGAVFGQRALELIDLRENRNRASRPVPGITPASTLSSGHFRFHRPPATFAPRRIRATDAIRDLARSGKSAGARVKRRLGGCARSRDPRPTNR